MAEDQQAEDQKIKDQKKALEAGIKELEDMITIYCGKREEVYLELALNKERSNMYSEMISNLNDCKSRLGQKLKVLELKALVPK